MSNVQQQLDQGRAVEVPQLIQPAQKQEIDFELTAASGFEANDRTQGSKAFEGTGASGFQANDRDDFELSQSIGTFVSAAPDQTGSKFNNPANRDEKALTGTGAYQFEDLEEDFDEYDEAEKDAQELNEVVDVYAQALKHAPVQHDELPVGKFP